MGEPPLVRLTFFLIFLREYGLHYLLSTQDWSIRLNLFFQQGWKKCLRYTNHRRATCLLTKLQVTVARSSGSNGCKNIEIF